jgi:hypothetical protein
VYVSGADLYYNDTAGNHVRLTAGGVVNATSSGIASGSASASFSSGVLVVDSNTNTPGNIQAGSYLMGQNVVGSNFLTLSPPSSLSSGSYSLILPALPTLGKGILTLDTSGNIATAPAAPPSETSFVLMDSAGNVTTGTALAGQNVVVSNTNATKNLALIRVGINLTATVVTIVAGEGANASYGGTGVLTVNFTTPFADTPVVVCTPEPNGYTATVESVSGSSCLVRTYSTSAGTPQSCTVNIIAIGQV